MDGKYIIILLFIFLVFLMGSINSTVTNNFYNNTTGSQDHAVLSNLSYADSNHTGFQSSDTLNTDVSALGYVTNNITTNININGYQITNQSIEYGNSFPSNPAYGMWFLRNDTGIIYMYDGGEWKSITTTFTDLNLYVGKNGSDTATSGFSSSTPCVTWMNCISKIPASVNGNITVQDVTGGVYVENIILSGINVASGKKLILQGTYTVLDSGTLSTGTYKISNTAQINITDATKAWSADQYSNKIVKIVNGTYANEYRIIDNNSATKLELIKTIGTTNGLKIDSGTAYQILEWNTTIKPTLPTSIKIKALANVQIKDMSLDSGFGSFSSTYEIYNSNITTYYIAAAGVEDEYSYSISSNYFIFDSILTRNNSNTNYLGWTSRDSMATFRGTKFINYKNAHGLLVQAGYALLQEGTKFFNNKNAVYVDAGGIVQCDAGSLNTLHPFLFNNTVAITMVSGKELGCDQTTSFYGNTADWAINTVSAESKTKNAEGVTTLVAGTATVTNTKVKANSKIMITAQLDGGTVGYQRISSRVVGTSFTITSSSALDTSTIAWQLYNID